MIKHSILILTISLVKCDCQFEFRDFGRSLLVDGVSEVIQQTLTSDFEPVHVLSGEFEEKYELADFKDQLLGKLSFEGAVAMCLHDIKNCGSQNNHRKRNVLVVLKSFDGFNKILKTFSRERFQLNGLFVFVHLDEPNYFEVQKMFESLWKYQIFNVIVLSGDHIELNLQTFIPFRAGSCEDTSPVRINVYRDGKFLNDIGNLFPEKMKNLYGCPIRVSITNNIKPYIFTVTLPNGTEKWRGSEISTISGVSKSLNFSIVYTHTDSSGINKTGALTAVQVGKADLSLAFWWLSSDRLKILDCTNAYNS